MGFLKYTVQHIHIYIHILHLSDSAAPVSSDGLQHLRRGGLVKNDGGPG